MIIHSKISKSLLLIFIFLIMIVDCKKKKGIDSVEWKDESLKITAEICQKYRTCTDENWSGVPEKLKSFTKSRLDEANCQKEFRSSNVYKLIGGDIQKIVMSYRECKNLILTTSCENLRKGFIDQQTVCVFIKKIQSGNP